MAQEKNTDFINVLRVAAAVIVLLSHILFMYYTGEASLALVYLREPSTVVPAITALRGMLDISEFQSFF